MTSEGQVVAMTLECKQEVKIYKAREKNEQMWTNNTARTLAVVKRPYDSCVGQFSPNVTVDDILRTLYIYLQPLWRNRPAKLSNSVK